MEMQLDLTNYPIWYTPFTQTLWFKILIFLGIIIVLAILIYFFISIRKRRAKIPYWEQLKKELVNLKSKNLAPKEFYGSLVTILKKYLQARFDLDLNNLTELEIVAKFKDFKVDYFGVDQLRTMFLIASEAKYNNLITSLDFNRDLDLVLDFIQKTEPTT